MTDYISREAAIRVASGYCHPANIAKELSKLPAADVREVVLCGDCKHSDTFVPDCTEATFPLKCLSIRYGGVYPNWFCEHGEKREEQDGR